MRRNGLNKQAIQASEVFDDEDYTDDEIRSFIEYYSNKNNGEYEPYCKAIVDCLEEMLLYGERPGRPNR